MLINQTRLRATARKPSEQTTTDALGINRHSTSGRFLLYQPLILSINIVLMRLANRTSAALLSGIFLRANQPVCSIKQTDQYHSMPAPVISVCHGGGPMPVLGDPGHAALIKSMTERVPKILGLGTSNAPRAIVLVTAHWSESRPTISNGSKHKLYYDYGGFPPESYKLKYDAPGSPAVAKEVYDALESVGMHPEMDSERGNVTPLMRGDAKLERLGSWSLRSNASH